MHCASTKLKPVKLFSQQLPTFLLFRHRRSVAQQCWIRLHGSSNIVGPRMVYKDSWVVSFPQCTAGPYIARSYWIRLQTTANTHATTPNIVGTTMLGVVASVCTQPYFHCRWLEDQEKGSGLRTVPTNGKWLCETSRSNQGLLKSKKKTRGNHAFFRDNCALIWRKTPNRHF